MSIRLEFSENFQLSDAKCNQTNQNLKQTKKVSEISEFSILFIGPNQKLGNLGNFHTFLIKPSYTTKSGRKVKLSKISEFSILDVE